VRESVPLNLDGSFVFAAFTNEDRRSCPMEFWRTLLEGYFTDSKTLQRDVLQFVLELLVVPNQWQSLPQTLPIL
jgi:hypothetical protein